VTTALSDPLIGRVLDGRYRIVARIARGGMATVYEALDQRLDRVVAVKSMHADLVRDEEFVARFIHEAHAAARLGHPNVVAVFDQGTAGDPYSRHRVVYLVMELVRGRTLRQVMRERGPLPPPDALAVIEPVLAALRAAHEARIVHRDIKPENVLLADDGRVKVADFGLARALTADAGHTRTSGLLLGTVSYLAPEQVQETGTDARADVYAAGIVLFEMLTGTKPFTAESPINVAYKHVNERVPAPSSRMPGIPPIVDRLVLRATDRDRDGRFVDGRDFLAAVRGVAADLRSAGSPERPDVDATATGTATPRPTASGMTPAGSTGTGATAAGSTGAGATPARAATSGARRVEPRPSGATAASDRQTTWLTRSSGSLDWPAAPTRTDHGAPAPEDPGSGEPSIRTARARSQQARTQRGPAGSTAPGRGRRPRRREPVGSVSLAEQRLRQDQLARRRRRRGAAAIVLVLLLASAVGVAAWWFGTGRFTSVPPLRGTTELTARSELARADLKMQVAATRFDAGVPAGYVLASQQPPNARLQRGATVSVVVSRGTRQAAIPALTGRTETAARAALTGAGLAVGSVDRSTSDQPSGQVTASTPAVGATVPAGTRVDLTLSTGPAPVTNPVVVGEPVAAATASIGAAGLPVVVVNTPSLSVPVGVVISAEPGDGPVPAHTTVTLTVSSGRPVVAVPNGLRGTDVAGASRSLTSLGFRVRVGRAAQWVGLNQVWSVSPAPGARLPYGSEVVLTIL